MYLSISVRKRTRPCRSPSWNYIRLLTVVDVGVNINSKIELEIIGFAHVWCGGFTSRYPWYSCRRAGFSFCNFFDTIFPCSGGPCIASSLFGCEDVFPYAGASSTVGWGIRDEPHACSYKFVEHRTYPNSSSNEGSCSCLRLFLRLDNPMAKAATATTALTTPAMTPTTSSVVSLGSEAAVVVFSPAFEPVFIAAEGSLGFEPLEASSGCWSCSCSLCTPSEPARHEAMSGSVFPTDSGHAIPKTLSQRSLMVLSLKCDGQ